MIAGSRCGGGRGEFCSATIHSLATGAGCPNLDHEAAGFVTGPPLLNRREGESTMRLACLLAVLTLFALPGGLGAQNAEFNIPFAFIGYDTEFQAGSYRVDHDNPYLLKIRQTDSDHPNSRWVVLIPKGESRNDGRIYLVFEKVGDFHVLREYRNSMTNTSMSTPLSRDRKAWEKTYIAKHQRGEFVLIAAR